MKKSFLTSLVFFAAPLPAFAVVTLQGVISGLAEGSASAGYASVGAGTPVSFSFDLPDVTRTFSGVGGAVYLGGPGPYQLAAALVGAPPPEGRGFSFWIYSGRFDPVAPRPERVAVVGSYEGVGDPALVFIDWVAFDDPSGTALEDAITSQVASIPLTEAALQAGRFSTGILALVDTLPGPGLSTGHRWSYTFTIVPEPAAMLLAATGAVLAWRRRRVV